MSEKGYVKPPERDGNNKKEYVKPPGSENKKEYVKPPGSENSENKDSGFNFEDIFKDVFKNSTKTNRKENTQRDYYGQNRNYEKQYKKNNSGNNIKKLAIGPLKILSKYFCTPRVGIKFYFNGYIVFMILYYLLMRSCTEPIYAKIRNPILAYAIFSNYSYSWYVDYKRYTGGFLSLFFTPFGSLKTATAATAISEFFTPESYTTSYSRTWDGSIRSVTTRDRRPIFSNTFVLAVTLEVAKMFIIIPFTFIIALMHPFTIKKYAAAVNRNSKYRL